MAGQDKILGEQLDIIDVSLDISTDSVAITHIATGLTTDSSAIAIIDADYLRRDGIVTMDGTLTITGAHDLAVGGNITVGGTVDGRDIFADAIAQTAHIADGSIHFTEANIDHDNILNSGSLYSHADIDTHIGLTNIHFTTLDGLSDVTSPSPTNGQLLTYDISLPGWTPKTAVTGIFDITAEPLGDLVDVILTGSPLLGQVLSYDGANWINSTPSSGVTDHTLLTSIGTNTHAQIDTQLADAASHISDGTIHFTEASISITKSQVTDFDITAEPLGDLSDVVVTGSPLVTNQVLTYDGVNWVNADVPTGITDHTLLTNIGTNTHAQIDTHIADGTVHFTQGSISITKSQVSDFDITAEPLGDLSDVVLGGSPLNGQTLTYDGANWINSTPSSGVTDHTLLTNIGTNTHAQIDTHISDSTIHYTQASIAITKSQVTDFDITAEPLGDLSDVVIGGSPLTNQVLTYDGANWINAAAQAGASALNDLTDVVIGGSPLTTDQVLTYDGANWINADAPTSITDHTLLTNIGTNTHAQIDTHISDGTIHYTQASIAITKSQVTDFGITAEPLGDLSDVVVAGSPLVTNQVLTYDGSNWINADVPTGVTVLDDLTDVVIGGSPLTGQTITYDGANWINSTPSSGITDHTLLSNIGTNTHAQIDTHIADATVHFTQAAISITKSQVTDFGITAEPLGDLLDVVIGGSPLTTDQVLTYDGANWINADVPTSITDHTLLTNIGTNTHAQIDTHISDSTIHYTQASIAITKSQVTDFGITAEPLGDLSDVVLGGSPLVADQVLTYDGANWINSTPSSGITDHTLLTNIGTNTHAQVDTHISDSTIHFTEASISITKSQVTDFGITAEPLGDLSDVVLGGSPLVTNQVLTYDGVNWINADVPVGVSVLDDLTDVVIGGSPLTTNQVLTYDGSNWINADVPTSITDHTLLTNVGTNTHAQIDSHIADTTIHFTEASINITKSQVTDFGITAEPLGDLSDVVLGGSPLIADQVLTYDGANWINADAVTSITDHTLLTNIGTNTHAQIDTHISDGTVHYTQATIAITKSQVTDFGITAEPLGDLSDVVIGGSPLVAEQVLTYDGVNWINSTPASGVTDHTLLTNIGTNTHTQIDTHISDGSIHYTQATIAITKTQVTDFGITAEPLGDLSDVVIGGSPLTTDQVLTYNGTNWINADVPSGVSALDDLTDVVIGGSPLTTDQVLTYDGANWINADAATSITDHTLLSNIGTNTHAQIDTHISDSTLHFTQANIAITKSQVTDFGITAEPIGDLSDVVIGGSPLVADQILVYDGANWINSNTLATHNHDADYVELIGDTMTGQLKGITPLAAEDVTRKDYVDTRTQVAWTTASQIGSSFSIPGVDSPVMAALDSTSVAIASWPLSELGKYSWDGTVWTQVGNILSMPAGSYGAMTALNSSTIVIRYPSLDLLTTYEWNGTDWVLVGNQLTVNGGTHGMTTLTSTSIAIADDQSDDLTTYSWDGTDWSKVGNSYSFLTNVGRTEITALDSTTIAVTEGNADLLQAYRFDGTDWTPVGNSLSAVSVITTLTTLNPTDIVHMDYGTDVFRIYRFDGTNWTQVGSDTPISGVATPAIAALNETDVAFIEGSSESLRTYRFDATYNDGAFEKIIDNRVRSYSTDNFVSLTGDTMTGDLVISKSSPHIIAECTDAAASSFFRATNTVDDTGMELLLSTNGQIGLRRTDSAGTALGNIFFTGPSSLEAVFTVAPRSDTAPTNVADLTRKDYVDGEILNHNHTTADITDAGTELATFAQGALATTATQPGDNVNTLTDDGTYVKVAGDTMTGDLTIVKSEPILTVSSNDGVGYATLRGVNTVDNTGFDLQLNPDGVITLQRINGSGTVVGNFWYSGTSNQQLTYADVPRSVIAPTNVADLTRKDYVDDTTVSLTGDTMTGDLLFGDNIDISLGTGGDFRLYHNGGNSVLKNITGGVFIESAASTIAVFTQSAARLYFESSQKLETVTGGINITGDTSISGQILADDGILSAPGYAFTSSANTGLYSTAGTTLGLTVSGVGRLFIDTDGSLSVAGTTNYETLVADDDDIPNKKYVDDEIAAGGSAGNMTVDSFVDGVDYNVGSPFNDTELTLTVTPGSENNIWVFFDGVEQHHTEFSISGSPAVLTFTEAIPLEVNAIEVISGTTLAVGTPSDSTVSTAKIVDGAVTLVKLATEVTDDIAERHTGEKVLIESQTASASASLDFTTGISSTYDVYIFEFEDVAPVTGGTTLGVQVSHDTGSTWETTSGDYRDNGTNRTMMRVSGAGILSNNATEGGLCGNIKIYNTQDTSYYVRALAVAAYRNSSNGDDTDGVIGSAYHAALTAIDGFRVSMITGNISRGTVKLYGIVK